MHCAAPTVFYRQGGRCQTRICGLGVGKSFLPSHLHRGRRTVPCSSTPNAATIHQWAPVLGDGCTEGWRAFARRGHSVEVVAVGHKRRETERAARRFAETPASRASSTDDLRTSGMVGQTRIRLRKRRGVPMRTPALLTCATGETADAIARKRLAPRGPGRPGSQRSFGRGWERPGSPMDCCGFGAVRVLRTPPRVAPGPAILAEGSFSAASRRRTTSGGLLVARGMSFGGSGVSPGQRFS